MRARRMTNPFPLVARSCGRKCARLTSYQDPAAGILPPASRTEHGHGLATVRHSTLTTGSHPAGLNLGSGSFLTDAPDLFITPVSWRKIPISLIDRCSECYRWFQTDRTSLW